MRISGVIQDQLNGLEERKRIQQLQRKEVGDTYRKNAQYFQPAINPVLAELEKLLTGEKDYSQYEEQKEEKPEVKAAIRELQQTERNVRVHEQAHMAAGGGVTGAVSYKYTEGPDGESYISGGEVPVSASSTGSTDNETIEILEQVKLAALAPTDPSPQDLRVAASASAQIQQAKAQLSTGEVDEQEQVEPPAFVNEKIEAVVPERFSKEFNLDAKEDTLFGKSLDDVYKSKLFNYAIARYTSQKEMVSNGYSGMKEPLFSLTA